MAFGDEDAISRFGGVVIVLVVLVLGFETVLILGSQQKTISLVESAGNTALLRNIGNAELGLDELKIFVNQEPATIVNSSVRLKPGEQISVEFQTDQTGENLEVVIQGPQNELKFSTTIVIDLGQVSSCGNGVCDAGENCPVDVNSCAISTCFVSTCENGCGLVPLGNGLTDLNCVGSVGCAEGNCHCNGSGVCVGTVPDTNDPLGCQNQCSYAGQPNGCYSATQLSRCGNFDSDSCLEYGPVNCDVNQSCLDGSCVNQPPPLNCTAGQTRFCSNQVGVCSNASETCTSNAWPGCTNATYLANNSKFEFTELSCSDGLDNDCDGLVDCADPACPACAAFYGMRIESVTGDASMITVQTTGALYKISQTQIELWRRIDPQTNTVNPKAVGLILFNQNIGPLAISSSSNLSAVISSTKATLTFNSDSLFIIQAKEALDLSHQNLIANAPWNKGTGLDRMWTDGLGGTLHAKWSGNPSATSQTTDTTSIHLNPNDATAHMAYPPKPFDFEGLYGQNSRPFVRFINNSALAGYNANDSQFDSLVADHVGVFFIWNDIYDQGDDWAEMLPNGVVGYTVRADTESTLRTFIQKAHAKGFKVIVYLSWIAGWNQPLPVTLNWMKGFRQNYGLDGWYFDSSDTGTWLSNDWNFIREVRLEVGDGGILYNHDSGDVWGTASGVRAVMVDAYFNYTLTGEWGLDPPNVTAKIDHPNDSYLRYYASGYGLSQVWGGLKRRSDGKIAISEEEKNRVIAENLHGVDWANPDYSYDSWRNSTVAGYEIAKARYASGNGIALNWPVSTTNGWFRDAGVTVTPRTGTSATVSWTTNDPATSEVSYTSNDVWCETYPQFPDGPDGLAESSSLSTSHSLLLSNLKPNTAYKLRIRSNNGQSALASQVIWGGLSAFSSTSADSDGDNLPDDWEQLFFGNLNASAGDDLDGDLVSNLLEYSHGTNPAVSDAVATCNFNGVCEAGNGESLGTCLVDCAGSNWLANWSFDDGSARNFLGSGSNGSLFGAEWVASGGHNNRGAFAFDPDSALPDDFIRLESDIALPNSFSIAGWLKRSASGRFDVLTGGSFLMYSGISAGNYLIFSYPDASKSQQTCYASVPVSDLAWHHAAFVFDGSQLKIFLDGTNVTSATECRQPSSFGGISSSTTLVRTLGSIYSSRMKGLLDDVSVWGRALSDSEVCALAGRC